MTDHILFDVLPDDMATPEKLGRYRRIFTTSSIPELEGESYAGLSRFEAPQSVRVSASNPEKGATWDIHFVNYGRKEPSAKEAKGLIGDENPTPVTGIKADILYPSGSSIRKIQWMTPESPDLKDIAFEQAGNRVRFSAPEFLVYGVARVHLGSGTSTAGGGSIRTPSVSTHQEAKQITAVTNPRSVTRLHEDCDRTSDSHAH